MAGVFVREKMCSGTETTSRTRSTSHRRMSLSVTCTLTSSHSLTLSLSLSLSHSHFQIHTYTHTHTKTPTKTQTTDTHTFTWPHTPGTHPQGGTVPRQGCQAKLSRACRRGGRMLQARQHRHQDRMTAMRGHLEEETGSGRGKVEGEGEGERVERSWRCCSGVRAFVIQPSAWGHKR